jgi:hypothetical protein
MSIQVKLPRSRSIKVRTQIVVPDTLNVISDVDVSNVQDGYVLMYDDVLQKYTFVDPDTLLSKAVADNSLPQDFLNKLDTDLDDRIDFDGGGF